MPRKLPSFIAGFREYLEPMGSPVLFQHWTALWTLSAALERRVWVHTKKMDLFPNIFVILSAPPGIGKSTAMGPGRDLITSIAKDRVSMNSITYASYVDDLRAAKRSIVDSVSQKAIDYYCLNIFSPEFQVLFPDYDTKLLGKMTDIYDGKEYGESRRGGEGKNTFHMERVLVTMLAGTTPEHMFSTFPETAWNTGFMSRTILVWSTEVQLRSLFDEGGAGDRQLWEDLKHDIKLISDMYGKFVFNEEAKALIDVFHRSSVFGGPPHPKHPRLLNYATRRSTHMLKLMMLSAVDRAVEDYVLTRIDYDNAYQWLTAAEAEMPEMFKTQTTSGDVQITSELRHFVMEIYLRTKNTPVPEFMLTKYLLSRTQAFRVQAIIDAAVAAKWLRKEPVGGRGVCYVPLADDPLDEDRATQG